MAKSKDAVAMGASPSRPEPRASFYWDKESATLKGDMSALGVGAKVTVTLEGTISGYSEQEWGCNFDVKVKKAELATSGGDADEPGDRSLVTLTRKAGKGGK